MTKNDRAKIARYAAERGGEKIQVTRDGMVHIKGPMPNSIESGWWFAGWADAILAEIPSRGAIPAQALAGE
jgi:hypothetical protein